MNTYTDDQLDSKLKIIFSDHQGRERAIPRWELVITVFGLGSDHPRTDANPSDRRIRDAVERLRTHGWKILNMNDGRGRFLCSSEEEYWEWREKYAKQLKSIAATIRAMDRQARIDYPNLFQPSLFGRDVMEELLDSDLVLEAP